MTFEASFERQTGTIQTRAGPDVIGLLPERAAARLRQLRQKARDLNAVIPEFADRAEANALRGNAERRLQRMLAPRAENGFNLREDDPQVVQARQEFAKLAAEAQRLTELDQTRSAQWRSASRVVQAIEEYLQHGRPGGTALQNYDGEVPKLNKGETITDAVERYRRRARELRADQHRIQSAPYPSSYAKQRMTTQIEALAQAGTPDVASLVEHDRQITFATQRVTSSIFNAQPGAVGFSEMPDALALVVWLHRDALIAKLGAEITAEADDAAALSHEARQQQEAEVQGDLLAVERDEAALVWSAMAQNLPVAHRADSSPLAILGCRLETAPRVNPSPGTSPQHVITFGGSR